MSRQLRKNTFFEIDELGQWCSSLLEQEKILLEMLSEARLDENWVLWDEIFDKIGVITHKTQAMIDVQERMLELLGK
jgi:hypothetical protein